MLMSVSPQVAAVEAPPIAEAMSWVGTGPRNRVFLNLCQAVPSYPPAVELQAEFARLAQCFAGPLRGQSLGMLPAGECFDS